MIDIHLINVVLAGIGIGAGAVVLIAAAVIATATGVQRRAAMRSHRTIKPASATPRQASLVSPVQREPALRKL